MPESEFDFEKEFNKGMKIPCPACMEPMHMAARRCPSCQKEYSDDEVKAHISAKSKNLVPGCIAILCAGAIIIMIGKLVIDQASLSGTATVEASGMTQSDRIHWNVLTQRRVREQLRDPDSAIFSDVMVYPRSGQNPVVCGRVNSRNGFGGMSGPTRFIAAESVTFEQQATSEVFLNEWALYCY